MSRNLCPTFILIFSLCLLPCSVKAVPGDIQWTRIEDLPGDQHAACAAVIDGLVYIVGGQNPSGPPNYNKMRIYDPSTNTWSPGPSMPTRRYCPGAGVIEGPVGPELYVVGGYSGYAGLSTVERYIPSAGIWESVASLSETRGHGIMTAVVNNNLYAIGGFYNSGIFYATNEMYDRENDIWISKAFITKDSQPLPMQAGLVAVWEDKIYIFGGSTASGQLTTTLIYDTLTDTWSEGAEMPRSRVWGGAATFNDYIYLIGGAGGSKIIDVYDPVHNSWSTIDDYPGGNSFSPNIAQSDDLVYVLGDSFSKPGALECWVGEYNLSSGWVFMPPDAPDIGYSLDEGDLLCFFSFDFVQSFNIDTGGWFSHIPMGWVYVNWPFYYESDAGASWFALPPESGLWVYHFSTNQWEQLPRIIP